MNQIIKDILKKPEYSAKEFIITANGSSMIPTIVKGDKIHVDPSKRNFRTGEIIFGRDDSGALIVHRIVSTSPSLITKGDNVAFQTEGNVEALGKVVKIKRTPRSIFRRIWLYAKQCSNKIFSK